MADVAWPEADIEFYAEREGFSEEIEDTNARFQPEVGPEKSRRRSYVPTQTLEFSVLYTDAELEILLDFYNVDSKAGAKTFSATADVRTGLAAEYRWLAAPKYVPEGHNLWRVTLSVRRLP